jgi:protein involved in polysaccharide export with SLBB domain
MKYFKAIFVLLGICLISLQIQAQSMDPAKLKTLKADDLSNEQVAQLKAKLTADGVSIADFEKQAIAAGAQPAEVAKVIDRMNQGSAGSKQPEVDVAQEKKVIQQVEAKKDKKEEPNAIFGSELFNNPNISFAPNLNMPTPKNYVLSTGDLLVIDIYGFSEANYKLRISSEGYIRIPNVGPVSLNGLTIEQAKTRIEKYLEKNGFSRLKGGGTSVQITLGEIRSIKVTMIGEISVPGTYTFPSLATVYTALYASGGPGKNGSFRDIQLIRDNKIIETIDVYDFLMKGDKSNDLVLKDQDIIKVNSYKTRVTLLGQVKRPAIFEAIDTDNIQNIINYSGGFTENAYKSSINVVRVTSREKEILDVKADQYSSIKPANGDILTVGMILNRYANRVTIKGAIFRGGEFALTEGLTLSGLIKKADGLKEDAYLPKATLFRQNEDLTPTILSIDLRNIISGQKDVILQKEDMLEVYSKFEIREAYTVNINGEVLKPGIFPFSENMHVKDLIYLAGGLKENAGKSIEIARIKKDVNIFEKNSIRTEIIKYSLSNINDTLILHPFDMVLVKNDPGYMTLMSVTILGEVANPGSYVKESTDERLSSVVKRSGGLTATAFPEGATLYRSLKGDTIPGNVAINLVKAIENPGSSWDIILLSGDKVNIPREIQTVSITGQVFNPGQIMYKNGKTVRYYLSRGGGLNEKALKRGIYVTSANGELNSTRQVLFFRFYPKVTTGSNIFVPEKEKKEKMTETAKVGMIISITSTMATIGILLFQALKK